MIDDLFFIDYSLGCIEKGIPCLLETGHTIRQILENISLTNVTKGC